MTPSSASRDIHSSKAGKSFPSVALRRRSAEHPMAMFAIVAGFSFLTMAFVPTTGPAFTTLGASAQTEALMPSAKHPDLPIRESDLACQGQTWGDEDEGCLVKIAEESGKGDRIKVRRLASAEPLANTPNIF